MTESYRSYESDPLQRLSSNVQEQTRPYSQEKDGEPSDMPPTDEDPLPSHRFNNSRQARHAQVALVLKYLRSLDN
jgi:hypothetical protein